MRFYLGAPEPIWLERTDVPLFVSRNRLIRKRHGVIETPRHSYPRALGPWAMDSGGFEEITHHGRWRVDARRFARDADFLAEEIGNLEWAAPQDWMVEEKALCRSGLDVLTHQQYTVENFLELRGTSRQVPWIPVIQGQTVDDYRRHIDMYLDADVNLFKEPLVGVGSVCRRPDVEAAGIFEALTREGLRSMHGFGVAKESLYLSCHLLASADSLAWSEGARRLVVRPSPSAEPPPPDSFWTGDKAADSPFPPARHRFAYRAYVGKRVVAEGTATERGLSQALEYHQAVDGATSVNGFDRKARNDLDYALGWREQLLASLPDHCLRDAAPNVPVWEQYPSWEVPAPHSPGGPRRRGKPGTQPTRVLVHAIDEARYVDWVNRALEFEAEQGWFRGALFVHDGVERLVPATHRAVLSAAARRQLENPTPEEQARLFEHPDEVETIQRALSYRNPGPREGIDPVSYSEYAQLQVAGTTVQRGGDVLGAEEEAAHRREMDAWGVLEQIDQLMAQYRIDEETAVRRLVEDWRPYERFGDDSDFEVRDLLRIARRLEMRERWAQLRGEM